MNNNFNDLSKGLIDAVRGIMESKGAGAPKTEKQKELAAKAPPHDKITHADVLVARGVLKKHPAHGKLVVAKEEVEDLEELSTEKLLAYRKKARAADTIKHDVWADTADEKIKKKTGSYNPSLIQRAKAKLTKEEASGLSLARTVLNKMRNEEVEDLEELSDRMLKSYANKANKQANKMKNRYGPALRAPGNEGEYKKFANRQDGEDLARTKLAMRREEVEDLEELSQGKLTDYRAAAKKQGTGIQDKMKVGGGDWSKDGKDTKTLSKRLAGYKMAGRKVNPDLAATVGKAPRVAATEEVEHIDELSVDKMKAYRTAARADAMDADAVDDERRFRKRAAGSNTAGKKIVKKGGSLKTEEVEIDEAMNAYDRYTSTHGDLMKVVDSIKQHLQAHKKDAMAHHDKFTDKKGPHWGHVGDIDNVHFRLKDIHDQLARQGEYKLGEEVEQESDVALTEEEIAVLNELDANFDELNAEIEIDEARGRPPKEGSAAWKRRQEAEKKGETEGDEPRQHIIQQLQRAKLSMQGGAKIKFKNGEEHEVRGSHASKLLDKYAGMKPAEKESFQKEIGSSHEALKKHL